MKVVLQRVSEAAVTIDQQTKSRIGKGLLLLLGIAPEDTSTDIDWLCQKISKLRIFADKAGKMNLSAVDIDAEILVVSQFTLYANVKKGTRPSFVEAAPPDIAIPLYEAFVTKMSSLIGKPIKTGTFGADMKVQLVNDGPVTIILDSQNKG